jgi:hypothetical protein
VISAEQSLALRRTRWVQSHGEAVDGDVMMKPTKECEIVGMVVPASRSLVDVVGLQPIAAAAASDGADALVSHPDVTPGAGWDCLG